MLPQVSPANFALYPHLSAHAGFCSLTSAQRTVSALLEAFSQSKARNDLAQMKTICQCLLEGWSKAQRKQPLGWATERQYTRPWIAPKPNPKVAELYYQAYLQVVMDKDYQALKHKENLWN